MPEEKNVVRMGLIVGFGQKKPLPFRVVESHCRRSDKLKYSTYFGDKSYLGANPKSIIYPPNFNFDSASLKGIYGEDTCITWWNGNKAQNVYRQMLNYAPSMRMDKGRKKKEVSEEVRKGRREFFGTLIRWLVENGRLSEEAFRRGLTLRVNRLVSEYKRSIAKSSNLGGNVYVGSAQYEVPDEMRVFFWLFTRWSIRDFKLRGGKILKSVILVALIDMFLCKSGMQSCVLTEKEEFSVRSASMKKNVGYSKETDLFGDVKMRKITKSKPRGIVGDRKSSQSSYDAYVPSFASSLWKETRGNDVKWDLFIEGAEFLLKRSKKNFNLVFSVFKEDFKKKKVRVGVPKEVGPDGITVPDVLKRLREKMKKSGLGHLSDYRLQGYVCTASYYKRCDIDKLKSRVLKKRNGGSGKKRSFPKEHQLEFNWLENELSSAINKEDDVHCTDRRDLQFSDECLSEDTVLSVDRGEVQMKVQTRPGFFIGQDGWSGSEV